MGGPAVEEAVPGDVHVRGTGGTVVERADNVAAAENVIVLDEDVGTGELHCGADRVRPLGVAAAAALALHGLEAEVRVEPDPAPPQEPAIGVRTEPHNVVGLVGDVKGSERSLPAECNRLSAESNTTQIFGSLPQP